MAHHIPFASPHIHSTSQPGPNPTGSRPASKAPTNADIARRAYEKYEARGRVDGFDLQDWIAASTELAGEAVRQVGLPSPSQHPQSQ